MAFKIETDRLRIVEFGVADAPFLFELMNTPGWLQWIGDRNIREVSDAENFITEKFLASYVDLGFGLWKMELAESGAPIGMMGFVKRDTLPHPDIGFALLPGFEGRGYALEGAQATMMYGTETLEFPVIMSIVMEENTRSISLIEKLGLQRTGEVLEDHGDRVLVFSS
ncbi:GNAT family N-acetyltransferase [Cryomorphaceae bacterium]|nr:GNAT family N-acetyltransferase [Cryomorphaceae bacterium]